jgi:hypothetical protein
METTLPSQHLHHSRLLELPRELRDEIYFWVLDSVWITFSAANRCVKPTVNKSRRYSLALLLTCRQISSEVRLHWIGRVLFDLQSPESLLDVLAKVPTARVATVSHIWVNRGTETKNTARSVLRSPYHTLLLLIVVA